MVRLGPSSLLRAQDKYVLEVWPVYTTGTNATCPRGIRRPPPHQPTVTAEVDLYRPSSALYWR